MARFEHDKAGRAGKRVAACVVALTLASCLQVAPYGNASAAETGSAAAGATASGSGSNAGSASGASSDASGDSSTSLSAGSNTKDKGDEKKAEEAKESKEEEARKAKEAKEKEAAEKRKSADGIVDQVKGMDATLSKVQAERDSAERSLAEATEQREETQVRLEEESKKLESLQSELSDFVVDMYKQGGVTPYLDVMLRSTSYREFLNSWNMTVTVAERGEALAAEERAVRDAIEGELAECDARIAEAERAKTAADSKHKQIEATQLALNVQAQNLYLEAAEVIGDKNEIKKAKEAAEKAQKALDAAIERGLAGESSQVGDGAFANPCPDSTLSSGFGYRIFDNAFHKGIDMAAPEGTPYYAAESGTVIAATNGGGDNGGAGNWIVIDHGDGLVTKYMHSLVTLVSVGDHVERGQNIGLVGTTGQSTGPHLHFQVEADGTPVEPRAFL